MAKPHHSSYFCQTKIESVSEQRKDTLAFDITVTLIVKLLFIFALWYAFFSQPLDDLLTDQTVSDALLGNTHSSFNPTNTEGR